MTAGKLIAGKFAPSTPVEIAPGLDFGKLTLSSEEAFALSRVGRGMSAAELLASLGLEEAKADQVLSSLVVKNCLVERAHPAMAEKVDLTDDRKRETLSLESRLDNPNPFQLLGVADGAKAETCKAAYYDLSMRFHPDRYFGKNLGTFRSRIEKIFKRLTEAQTQVTDRDLRAALQKDHPEWFSAAASDAPKVVRDTGRGDDRARRIARHPYLAKTARQHDLLSRAKKAIEANHPADALMELQMVLGLDPNNAEARALMPKVQLAMGQQRARVALEEGVKLAGAHDHDRAVPYFLLAVEHFPTEDACVKGLASAVRVSDFKSAKVLASKWVEISPKSAKARMALADALHGAGMNKNAKREVEEALRLSPDLKEAKALLAKLRWA